MPVKLFLSLSAIVTCGIGLTLLLFPSFVANFFLPSPAHGTDIFIRFLGSSLIGYTYLNWYTTTLNNIIVMRATLVGNFSTLCIALIISLIGVLDHDLKSTGLYIVFLHFTFGTGFGWYVYKIKHTLR